jgi:hypothetical protein
MLDRAKQNENWTKPAAMTIPKGGMFESERGRFGPIFPRTDWSFACSLQRVPNSAHAASCRVMHDRWRQEHDGIEIRRDAEG